MMNTTERKQIADTILAQLGGGRFIAMTGAHSFRYDEGGELIFKLRRPCTWNTVKIELTPMDLYTMTFYRITNRKGTMSITHHAVENLYADQLAPIFERHTKLATSLMPANGVRQ